MNDVLKERNMASQDSRGFKISFDPIKSLLRVRIWGFWDVELAQKYEKAFMEKVEEFCRQGKAWYVFMDLTGLKY